jgi:hypothetical protein
MNSGTFALPGARHIQDSDPAFHYPFLDRFGLSARDTVLF